MSPLLGGVAAVDDDVGVGAGHEPQLGEEEHAVGDVDRMGGERSL